MAEQIKILVVDDDFAMRHSLSSWIKEEGYPVDVAESGEEALEKIKKDKWDIVFLDLKMPGMDGIEVLEKIKSFSEDVVVVMITAYGTIDTAVLAMKKGAYDYILKPFNPDEISVLIKKIEQHQNIILENIRLRNELEEKYTYKELIGKSPAMQEVFNLIKDVAPTNTSVLITGESGTGKELVARAIHRTSLRKEMPFIAVNCAALTESLLESELFGHEKGAFTGATYTKKGRFEMADGGTLFLDEVGEISPRTQVELLRVLQEKEFRRVGGTKVIKVDVRIISATNKDLEQAVKNGEFRVDLYYRLNVVNIHLPPLRERKEDIPLLAKRFLDRYTTELNKKIARISDDAMKILVEYDWPGNVRELENVIERAVVVGKGNEITPEDIPISLDRNGKLSSTVPTTLKDVEKEHIIRMLDLFDWNISRTAKALEIDRQTLYNKIKKYGIVRKNQ